MNVFDYTNGLLFWFVNKYSENILSSAQLKQEQVIDVIFTLYSFQGGTL